MGRIDVAWSVDGDRLTFGWKEIGGPPVALPEREGFGFSLLKGEVEYRLGGTAETTFDPEGLGVKISLPLAWNG